MEKNNKIFIVAQQFYGNRTGTEINREDVDSFLLGYTSAKDMTDGEYIDRKIVKVPNADNIIIVYDRNQENEYVNVRFPEQYKEHAAEYKERTGREFTMQVSCRIPEIDFEIHTRCFACRQDENGELQSLQDGDGERFIEYLPLR